MARLIALKLLRLVPVMALVTIGTFFLLELVPGDPALSIIGPDGTEDDYQRIRSELNLDDPIYERYVDWLADVVRGDLGERLTRQGFSVVEGIQQRFPVTLEITGLAMVMALLIAVPMGVWAAANQGQAFDRLSGGAAFGIISVPSFLAGLLLIFLFVFNESIPRYFVLVAGMLWVLWLIQRAVRQFVAAPTSLQDPLSIKPAADLAMAASIAALCVLAFIFWPDFNRQGFSRLTSEDGILENLRSAFLPSLTIALAEVAIFMRLLRSDMVATLQEDFILSAKAKGLTTRKILFRHALRPSSFSLITLAGVSFGRLIGGTVVVETIFNLPGMGTYIVNEGVSKVDYTVVQGGVLVLATVFVLLNAGVDIGYNFLDPRIRRGRR